MLLHIQYQDSRYNYVNPETLDELILSRRIRQFFRPSEWRWVDIKEASLRGPDGNYSGPERRMVQAAV
jgi:hypothetical protein